MKSLFSTFAIVLFVLSQSPIAHADDTAATTIKNDASDASTHMKKGARHAKRKMRKAVGKNTVGDDIKDTANDMGDDMNNAGKKVKNKINE